MVLMYDTAVGRRLRRTTSDEVATLEAIKIRPHLYSIRAADGYVAP